MMGELGSSRRRREMTWVPSSTTRGRMLERLIDVLS
jgi:hypothetical protein